MRQILIAAAAIAACAQLHSISAAEPRVCISADLGIEGLKAGDCFSSGETEDLLDLQVLSDRGEMLVYTMTSQLETRNVTTCREYISLSAEDAWAPPGERFERVCNVVMMLSGAQPAEQSHLRPGDSDLKDLERLTALIMPAMGDFDPVASPDMRSVADLVKTGEVAVVTDGQDAALSLGYQGMTASYRELARGDIDNDGIEDMLVERITTDPAHKHAINPLLLTRIEKDGLLVLNAMFAD